MGIAKSIEGFAVYADYSADTAIFVKTLSDKLNADFVINTYDKEYEPMHEAALHTTFNKTKKYRLTIQFDDFKVNDKTLGLPIYELQVPINYVYEDTVDLTFYPNNGVHLMFLTFEHLWSSLIDTLKFEAYYQNKQQAIERYHCLRREYISFLKKLDIDRIFIITHAYYHIENIFDTVEYPKLSFDDILCFAKEKDKLTSFCFEEIMKADNISALSKDFLDKPDLEIGLVDNLNRL